MTEREPTRKRYHGGAVDVSFDPVRCRHAAECVQGLPGVFDTHRRPWILPDGADPEDVVRVVARCPTGALRTHPRTSVAGEVPVTPTEVTAIRGGPVLLRGHLRVTGPDWDAELETRAALCSCGGTSNTPYCDGSGTCADWLIAAPEGRIVEPVWPKWAKKSRRAGSRPRRSARLLPRRRAQSRSGRRRSRRR